MAGWKWLSIRKRLLNLNWYKAIYPTLYGECDIHARIKVNACSLKEPKDMQLTKR